MFIVAIAQNLKNLTWLCAAALGAGLIGNYLLFPLLVKLTKRTKFALDNSFVKCCFRPLMWVIVLLAVRIALKLPTFAVQAPDFVSHLLSLLLIALVSWLLIKTTYVLEDYVVSRFDIGAKDNLSARKIQTQFRVLKRIVIAVVFIIAFGTMLMTFDRVRQLGTTILASAGVAGVVVGMAAQRTIATFIAGLQVAITQPFRVDDVVIVENEWGRIEEITLTYVVVKIWDQRRLIVPITYFIERPFQNWTRTTADILGTVFIYVDYTVPIEIVREQLQKILESSELWDRKVCVLQVTNATDKTVELRALMSAADASAAWGLRCHVREKLVEFINERCPKALPRVRAELQQLKDIA